MRQTLYSLALLLATLLTACDDISDEGRFTEVDPTDVAVRRNVLVEDFTGQKCSNCPAATRELGKIQEAFGENHVIAVAIHGGPLAVYQRGNIVGLRNELADEYYRAFNVPDNPKGLIDRKSGIKAPEEWLPAVARRISLIAPVELSLSAKKEGGELVVDVTAKSEDSAVDGKLQLWVLEDGIVAQQAVINADETVTNDKNYVHNHVLRAAINGAWGEDISLAREEAKTLTRSIALEPAWNAERLSVVAFVYTDKDGVLQVEKTNLK